jgi:hydroxyacylglutathione hydrolase
MTIERTISPLFAVNTYWVIENEHIILIDPVAPLENGKCSHTVYYFDFAILTHEHYDHISSVNELKTEYGFPVFCGESAKNGLMDPTVNMSRYVEFLKQYIPFGTGEADSCYYSCQADRFLKSGEIVEWQGHELQFIETPGHSKGSICVLLDDRYLFSGDTIFKEYPTATRMPGGSTKAFRTITEPWLDSLPQDIVVYPGHTEPFRLSERYKTSH